MRPPFISVADELVLEEVEIPVVEELIPISRGGDVFRGTREIKVEDEIALVEKYCKGDNNALGKMFRVYQDFL